MKKLWIFLLTGFAVQAYGQNYAITNAFDLMSTYQTEKSAGNEGAAIQALTDAKKEIDPVTSNPQTSGMSKAWSRKGEVYYYIFADPSPRLTLIKSGALDTALACFYKAATIEKNEKGKSIIPDKDNMLMMVGRLGDTLVKMAGIRYENGEFQSAIESYSQAKVAYEVYAILDPKNKDIPNIIQVCGDNVANTAVNSGKIELITKYVEPMVNNGTATAYGYSTLANVYLDKGDVNKAKEIITTGKAKFPNDANIAITELNVAFTQGDNDAAGKLLEDAKTKFPDQKANFILLEVNFLLNKGDNEKAIVALDEAMNTYKDNKDVFTLLNFNTGVIYDQMAEKAKEAKDITKCNEYRTKALGYYDKTIEVNPGYAAAYYQKASYYVNRGNDFVDEANALPLEKEKEYNDLRLKAQEEYKQAVTFLEKAYEIDKQDRYKNALVTLYEKTQQYDKKKALLGQ